ncbi:DNA alkylation repair protein [Streptomyces mobaraensis NBRC 13819 = DSM 40847]|uniref:DNA alkylation repair protein n=2 Tax=Streptomyces mobaraensis TaxID=35621 RepID=A0A5N5W5J6_STRMB|nr:DNA alkylation repair protein [Streptomyces mobaraensis]EME96492.1 DNA alkylation repair enzyme [Streptomyces mobaraensis NBRC 13819 = DSM 40847]KAB7839539.1 DNA alkylation repair protein [Streptomyces mobaraensis]QTT77318.1 DNA alkylation repair protein [Streptomyces mobaraensis NBRC 13819 = DSM 40847]
MADFKDELSPELIGRLAGDLARASASFDRTAFERLAATGIGELELMARIDRIARALAATMPASPEEADRVIRGALDGGGLLRWASMPVNAYVASALLDRPDVALPLLAALTPRCTAEFALRPFVDAHYEATMDRLRAWTTDPDEHVRRLVSEGTRPRLPWARQLSRFVADPAPALALLEALFNDESLYVRRSVANHLNDISKDHPDLALDAARRWSRSSTRGDFVVRHGLRTLVKRGHPEALAVLGFDHQAPIGITDLACSPSTISIGETTTVTFTLHATEATRAAIDYLVHYQGVRGPKAGKVFKLTVQDLPAGQAVRFSRRHRFASLSVRTIHPGPHRIEVQANGRVLGATEVHITAGEASDGPA